MLEHGRAVGVEFPRDGRLEQVRGSRVILSAGALLSPTLLLRSGIGPARLTLPRWASTASSTCRASART